ncbi:hypothetical protein [Marivita sp.]|uniref:hypothetical protein n=1 Tax=Marivita sp. TaxID=2003365 RepID=UPI003F6FF8A1
MAKILTFRNKGHAPSGQDFLTDENQTLSFRTNEDGAVSLGGLSKTGLPTLFPDPKKDWSNQELADLFRVRQLLSGANVPVETDRGVSDEGDPWFVFCHASGEVFIHLCRIDGLYLLDSPNVLRPLRGADFNALIADFTNQALPTGGSEDDSTRRVIRLERGGKVRLHPSAMLAALIWTLFLASEELVLLAPEEETDSDSDALLDFDGMFAVETARTIDIDMVFEDDTVDVSHLIRDGANASDHMASALEAHAQLREAQLQQQQGLTVQNNAFTMGLSTIAIAMGFMSETVLLDNQRKVLEGLKELGFTKYSDEAQQTAELDIPAGAEGNALLAMLADFLGLDLSLSTDVAEVLINDPARAEEDLTHLTEEVVAEDAIVPVKAAAPAVIRNKNSDPDQDAPEALRTDPALDTDSAQASGNDTLSAEAAQDSLPLTLSEIVQTWQPLMQEFQLGQTMIKASFDVSNMDAFALFDLIDVSANDRSANVREFDNLAQRLIEFLEAKDGDLGFIELENEVIMIDRTAVTGGETEFIQWQAEDGRTISFIGLAADFQQFDMIA